MFCLVTEYLGGPPKKNVGEFNGLAAHAAPIGGVHFVKHRNARTVCDWLRSVPITKHHAGNSYR